MTTEEAEKLRQAEVDKLLGREKEGEGAEEDDEDGEEGEDGEGGDEEGDAEVRLNVL